MSNDWTGGRLDDLNQRVGEGFVRVDADIRAVRSEMATMHIEMNDRFEAMNREMNARFEAMQRLILQVGGGVIATMAMGFLSLVVAQLM